MKKPCIVQHVANFQQIGGPASILRRELSSPLANKYDYVVVSQDYPARGINFALIKEMAFKIKAHKPDLVHVRGLQNEGFHGILAAYLAGCRNVIVGVHGFAWDARFSYKNLWRPWIVSRLLEPLTLILARQVYCVCNYVMNQPIIRRYASKKCRVIYNGVELYPPEPRDMNFRIQLGATSTDIVALYAGRVVWDKGLGVLAESLRRTRIPDITWIAGDGSDYDALRFEFGDLIGSGRVRFLGRRNDIPKLLNACDFFVFPTLHENLSSSLLEAMSASRPVLATDVGGNPELVVNFETGILIPPNDIVALEKGLEFMSAHPDLRISMGQQGRRRIEKYFSVSHMIKNLDELYSMLLNGG